jgi:uncharacterized membrane protein YfcA
MIRTLGGIAAGLAAAIVLMMVTEAIGYQVAPAPMQLDFGSLEEAPEAPALSLLFPVVGWFLGSLVGGWVSIRISDRPWTAWAVAAVVFLAAVLNFLMMASPAWLIVAGLVVAPLGAWLAQKLCELTEKASA